MCFAVLEWLQLIDESVDTTRVPTGDQHNWQRRGWLVLLRARHQRVNEAVISRRWYHTSYLRCSNREANVVLMGVIPLPREQQDVEGGQGAVAHNSSLLEYRQLLMGVVEHEEVGVFRSIVEYL